MATVEAIVTSWLDGAYGLNCVLLQIAGHSVASYLSEMQHISTSLHHLRPELLREPHEALHSLALLTFQPQYLSVSGVIMITLQSRPGACLQYGGALTYPGLTVSLGSQNSN